jgi:GTP-binding protein Era|tara:strand:- start:724 stop:1608 length:885 start_codon:yes stop_codon:yes gene_type:complete
VKHRSAFINIIGNPNVGKSSLVNLFLDEKLSIISSKAQTTRHRIFCILNNKNYQFVFSDTPGIIKPMNKLHESMMNFVESSYNDADIILYVVDSSQTKFLNEDLTLKLKSLKIPIVIVVNKIDLIDENTLELVVKDIKEKFNDSAIYPVSVKENFNVKTILDKLEELSPISPPFFPKDQITDKPERFFVNEIIREKILNFYKKEIPYSVEVVTNSFKPSSKILKIDSTIYVERSSQKGIVIGHKGKSLTEIGKKARLELEDFFNKKVFLELRVKVSKNWKSNNTSLKRFGYDLS